MKTNDLELLIYSYVGKRGTRRGLVEYARVLPRSLLVYAKTCLGLTKGVCFLATLLEFFGEIRCIPIFSKYVAFLPFPRKRYTAFLFFYIRRISAFSRKRYTAFQRVRRDTDGVVVVLDTRRAYRNAAQKTTR